MVSSNLAFYSTNELPRKLKELENNWEHFIFEKEVPKTNEVRLEVLESWKRCQQYGVDPLQKETPIKVSEDKLKEQIHQSKLYDISLPIIEDFSKQISGTSHLITLGDDEGKIIYLKGDREILNKAERMNFVVGADWSEQSAGSNAIGTSLAAEKPIQILSSEHYCQGVHPWVCSSAPIRDPRTNKLLGVIDLTGPSTSAQSHSLSVVQNVSNLIVQHLFIHSHDIFKHLQDTYDEVKRKKTSAHVMVLDEMLNVVHADESCLDVFSINHWDDLWDNKQLHSLKNSLLSRNPHQHEWEWDVSSLQLKIFIRSITFNSEHIGFVFFIEKLYQYHPSDSNKQTALKGVIGQSAAMRNVIQKVEVVADKNVPVLITGESGTGKEIFAHNIHLKSSRKHQPFIAINCGAIPENLITSELFGYVRGAFTGGDPQGKKGKFEEANGGTLLLDEIGEMPLDLQVHLLRVLQEKEVTPIGSSTPIPIDVRIIAATNKNLEKLIEEGTFRSDLYYRLNVVELHLPPLKQREGDIPLLCRYFATELARNHGREVPTIDKEVIAFFNEYHWPGNIREMMNVMEYAILFNGDNHIKMESLPKSIIEKYETVNTSSKDRFSLAKRAEREEIIQLIEETNGNLSEVARRCNIARTTLYRRMKKYNINRK
ncbi:sigma-54-dependent Fis family transcriptional regulator [Aliibacillus thermotolerans]|uniref:Sigma-54-dependent Fis family transcriptional regulator n=1 Tax=Aliibacillus thermotolerans TaxID=1834418 RepID=A0ABW0U1M2_9BACI|nr:sigma-54-dependent Fis family transcriptional regulator [Aliibacillus thermotolerans]MDA3129494.1 GAF domain-containing protein [Aliibacillus thermotolerans]